MRKTHTESRPDWKSPNKIPHSWCSNKTSTALIRLLLEFVARPKGQIVQVAAGLRLLQKAAGVENSVIRLEPQMAIGLPPDFSAGPVSNESGAAAIGSADEEAGYGVHAIVDVFPPLDDPIERHAHAVGKRRFHARVNVYKVNWARTRGGQNAKVIAFRKQRIERSQSFRIWVVAARNIRFCTEPGSQRNDWDAIACFGGDGPGLNVRRTERAELPEAFVVEIPAGLFGGNRAGKPRSHGVAHFLRSATLKMRFLAIQAQVISL